MAEGHEQFSVTREAGPGQPGGEHKMQKGEEARPVMSEEHADSLIFSFSGGYVAGLLSVLYRRKPWAV